MKRYAFLLLTAVMLFTSCSYEVRTVRSRPKMSSPGGLFYALPRTEVCVDITVGHYDTVGAPFVKFAEEMLSVSSQFGGYDLRGVALTTRVVADANQYYYVRPRSINVQVDNRSLLRSVGMDADELAAINEHARNAVVADGDEPLRPEYNLYDRADTFYTRADRPGHPSKVASKKDSRSLRQQALAAAERVRQLQERRQQLLSGESDVAYTPEGLRVLLDLINHEEQQLVEQFVGRYEIETVRYAYDPRDEKTLIDSQTVMLCRFSPQRGLVDTADADAMPIYLSLRCDNQMRTAARYVKYRVGIFGKNDMNSRNTFKYRLSEQAVVTAYCDLFSLEKRLPIAQFGPTMELPKGKVKALFDSQTGDLIYMAN